MKNDHILGEQEVLYMVKDKFSSLGLNDNKIDMEPIDEDKLDELARKFVTEGRDIPYSNQIEERVAFKAGYRKAMEG